MSELEFVSLDDFLAEEAGIPDGISDAEDWIPHNLGHRHTLYGEWAEPPLTSSDKFDACVRGPRADPFDRRAALEVWDSRIHFRREDFSRRWRLPYSWNEPTEAVVETPTPSSDLDQGCQHDYVVIADEAGSNEVVVECALCGVVNLGTLSDRRAG